MQIREARYEDAAGIGVVHVDTWRSTYRGIVPDSYLDSLNHESATLKWQERLTNRELMSFHLIAEADDGRIVGIAEAGLNDDEHFPEYEGQVYTLYILKEHQGNGVGRLLMDAIVERFLQIGIENMLVWVVSKNPSRGFYERLGGEFLGTSTLNIHGLDVEESAYGWDDISAIPEARNGREHLHA